MNTPAHVAINLVVFARALPPKVQMVVVAGAVLPDAPMFWFYFQQKIIEAKSETEIWSTAYFEPGWQALFDSFNSIPLLVGALAVSWLARARLWSLLFASMLLHTLLDLPVHREDAHRHFFPFADWRFYSPVSYWDPHHYGFLFGAFEALVVGVCCTLLYRSAVKGANRVIAILLGGVYLAYFGFASAVWA